MAKILIVEDNIDLHDFLTLFLQLNNYEVQSASTREEVFIKLQTFSPELVLMDVILGADNGRDICKELKKVNKNVFVTLISANSKALLNHTECSADDIIEKPFNNQDILDKIRKYLKE